MPSAFICDPDCPAACCRLINCPLLTDDNRCSVYNDRPDWCRVGYSKPEGESWRDYLKKTVQACKTLKDRYVSRHH